MDNITTSEIAGFGVGTLLFCATLAAPKVDAIISTSQRRSLGMCRKCGDLKLIVCSRCKGTGLIKPGVSYASDLMNNLFQSFGGDNSKPMLNSCVKCQARGHFNCPECTNL